MAASSISDVAPSWRRLNQANWDERTAAHLGPRGYDLSTHRAGRGWLDPMVEAAIGDIAGRSVLHLQCHVGQDSVALAQRGARRVVGVDFSPPALDAAAALAAECGLPDTRFVLADAQDVPAALPDEAGAFDLVFTSWGTICWLPDLDRWAAGIAFALRPGGAFVFADMHPVARVLGDPATAAPGFPGWACSYFETGPIEFDDPTDYQDPEAHLANSRTVEFQHGLAGILGALRGAGLAMERLEEHPRLIWQPFPGCVQDADGLWTWPDKPWLPLALVLRAVKP
ncbi:bifunctional 2-polyprenyl-6-hydroxyphenol methylase/3-demethylubiquinol 3-O-methyltransferase UbiG [Roseomonas sp. AR75]|jgi:SAM-dependent methyltransferase|uniref:class I SAM-dependent methyltransferase n=1 Tax=Roseomonas sp. AR75 TaxID=2562311 RepID=UPI001484EDD8|nr:class I SAM-dependent methyltransferase [Roseomonas sp. AR75]